MRARLHLREGLLVSFSREIYQLYNQPGELRLDTVLLLRDAQTMSSRGGDRGTIIMIMGKPFKSTMLACAVLHLFRGQGMEYKPGRDTHLNNLGLREKPFYIIH